MVEESANLKLSRPDERPPGGQTIIAKVGNLTSTDLLEEIKSVWAVIAAWGRWFDEELGDWPSNEQMLRELPSWVQEFLPDIEIWSDRLHDRDWMWWSGTAFEQCIKIDVALESYPFSLWPLAALVEWTGGEIIYQDTWLDSNEMKTLLG